MSTSSSDFHSQVADSVRSGDYYSDAMAWYQTKYHSPMPERCLFIVITALAIATTFFSVRAVLGLFPLTNETPIAIYRANIDNTTARMVSLARDGGDVNAPLRKYFVSDYVLTRERYVPQLLEQHVRHIKHLSSPAVYKAYRKYIAVSNPKSPVVQYERHTVRNVAVRTIRITPADKSDDDRGHYYNATVEFEAVTVSIDENNTSRWVAELEFRYLDLEVNQDTGAESPMEFLVTSYAVREKSG